MLVGGDQLLGHREGDRGLADPARAYDGQKALSQKLIRQPGDRVVAANQSCQQRRQIVRVLRLGWLGSSYPRFLSARDRRYKGIAASRDIDQIAVTTAQGPAQRAD